MAWLGDDTSERVDQATYNFRAQFSTVKKWLDDGGDPGELADQSYPEKTEIVRRIRQNVVSFAWPGLTSTAAQAKLAMLRSDPQHKNPTAKWNGAGGYDVTSTRVQVDPAGWSTWMSLKDAEEAWS